MPYKFPSYNVIIVPCVFVCVESTCCIWCCVCRVLTALKLSRTVTIQLCYHGKQLSRDCDRRSLGHVTKIKTRDLKRAALFYMPLYTIYK